MHEAQPLESLFVRFRERGDASALAAVFDRCAPELGRVASYLSGGDRHRAEDLLQATWLAAITHGSRWDPERPLLPWLLGVLANHARSARRTAQRQLPGAAEFGTLLASDDPMQASEHAEFRQLLADALARLPSPFREPVSLHVQHGLTANEIAAVLGRPAGTVRTQIVRGLDRLRALLPHGLCAVGVAAVALTAEQLLRVRTAVLEAAGPAVPASFAPRLGLYAVAALAVAGLATLALNWRPVAAAPPSAIATPVVAVVPAADAAPTQGLVPTAAPARDPAAPEVVARRRITVRVRHEDEPLVEAGEWVGLVEHDDVRFERTDERGEVVFDDVVEQLYHRVFLSGTQVHGAQTMLQDPGTFDVAIDLTVPAQRSLAVTVVDADGRAVAGAEIDGNGAQWATRTWCPLGVTGPDGVLRRRGLPEHGTQLRARAPGHGPSRWADTETVADGALACRLRLTRPGPALRGRVVDPDGAPIAAELGTIAFGSDLVEPFHDRTADDGTFVFDWLPKGHVAIVARTLDASRRLTGLVRAELPGHDAVEIRVDRGATLRGTTRFHDGGPGGGSHVSARLLEDGAHAFPFAQRNLRSVGAGDFELGGLLPGRWLMKATIGDVDVSTIVELRQGEVATWDAVAPPVRALRVRVRDERGEPLAGWHVLPRGERGVSIAGVNVTDEHGQTLEHANWLLPGDRPIELALFDPPAFQLSQSFPVWRVPAVVAAGDVVDVTVPDRARATRAVRGRVVDALGAPLPATVMAVSAAVWWTGPSVASDALGAFAIGPFAPQRLTLVVSVPGRPTLRLADVEVPAAGDLDLGDVVVGAAGAVRLVASEGTPVPDDLQLALVAGVGGARHTLKRLAGGAFGSDMLPCGDYVLDGSAAAFRVPAMPVRVTQAGEQSPVTFRLVAAPTLRVAVVLDHEARAQMGWNSTLVVRRGGAVVLRRSLARRFHGSVASPLEFAAAVEPGDYVVELDDKWSVRRLPVHVDEGGGVVTFAAGG